MAEGLQLEFWKVWDLTPYEFNNKDHPEKQLEALVDIISRLWFKNPIQIDEAGVIIAGHARLKAAEKLGLEKVPVLVIADLDENQKKELRIADNIIADLGQYNKAFLELELAEIWDHKLAALVQEVIPELDISKVWVPGEEEIIKEGTEDNTPEVEPAVLISNGSIVEIWDHKIICGDSLEPDTYKLLLGEEKVDLVITDPPYWVDYSVKNDFLNNYDNGNGNIKAIENDAIEDYYKFFSWFLEPIKKYLAEENLVYIFITKEIHNLKKAFIDQWYHDSNTLVWVKNNHVFGRLDYHPKHELVVYGWYWKHKFYWLGEFSNAVFDFEEKALKKMEKADLIKTIKKMAAAKTDIIPVDKPHKSDLHPTMKPVRLYENFIKDWSKEGAILLDVFGGSGTAVIAAEKTKRKARIIEKSPEYVEVIIKRFLEQTKQETFIVDGEIINKEIFKI